jgi:hypothetical protein
MEECCSVDTEKGPTTMKKKKKAGMCSSRRQKGVGFLL